MLPVIVLLAGENSRFWPLGRARSKALYEVGFWKPILWYTLRECEIANVPRVIIVKRPADEGIERLLSRFSFSIPVSTVVQKTPQGMADALLSATSLLEPGGKFFLLDGNQIFFSQVVQRILFSMRMRAAAGAIAVRSTGMPERFGIVTCDPSGFLAQSALIRGVREKPKDFVPPQWRITATYCLPHQFLETLSRHRENVHCGFEEALNEYVRDNRFLAISVDRAHEDVTLKYPWDLFRVHEVLLEKEFATPGVDDSFEYDEERKILKHKTAFLHPTAVIEGPVYIGERVKIMEYAVVKNHSVIANDALIGSYSLVRDHTLVGEGAFVGAHTEVTRSLLYAGVKLHRNYVGDSILDRDASLGAGTVTANRRHDRKTVRSSVAGERMDTGLKSLGVVVGEKTNVGINAEIRPGIKMGRKVMVYEGVCVTRDIEDGVTLKKDGTEIRPQ